MKVVRTPQTRCRAAVARCDITPPIGIYHRMWGAALHDRATGVHRPLEATVLWLEPSRRSSGGPPTTELATPELAPCQPQIIVSLDHCILDSQELRSIRQAIEAETSVPYENVLITLSHTHGSGWMSRSRSHLPGGDLIGPYFEEIIEKLASLSSEAKNRVTEATIVYGTGRCNLAAHRDYLDIEQQRFVCGYNPAGLADDTLLIARVTSQAGTTLGSIVNYACHPTTLAWDNTLISPDWVGAMRETVEREEGAPCLFMQGASGDLGPRDGFVGDTAVADRNGRQVGYAALSALTALPPSGTEYRYVGAVTSGTAIGTWRHEPLAETTVDAQARWCWEELIVELPYRADLPTLEQTTQERDEWLAAETRARAALDELEVRNCRAEVEQRTRQLTRLNALVEGRCFPVTVKLGIVGEGIWIFVPGELYQVFQTTLRQRFAPIPVFVTTLTNDWQPGYIPPASSFGYGIYQEVIAATSAGSMELLIEAISRCLKAIA